MKAIYSTCWSDPWIKTALYLKQSLDIDPIYWIGYEDDDSESLVNKLFPKTIYHKYFDAWRGIFPKNVLQKQEYLDIDFLKEISNYELQAIKMMDRMDPDRYSFSFSERQRHFRNLLRKWLSVLDTIQPDFVISAVVPHRVYDYALFLICNKKKIPFISFRNTAFPGRIIPLKGIYDIESSILETYNRMKETLSDQELIIKLPRDIRKEYEKIVYKDYKTAEPNYMKKHIVSNKKNSSILGITRSFLKRVILHKHKFFGHNGYFYRSIPTYLKNRKKGIEDNNASILWHAFRKIKSNSYKNMLRKYYEKFVEKPDYMNDQYIFFPLHYQPEMTSNPSGDIFVDQMLCLDILRKNIPPNYYIYIKEHRSQFYSHTEGHTSRFKEFYDDLTAFPNVKLMPLDEDVFELINFSTAVATVTGTAGWEAMVRKKPVIIFGLSWYEDYDGVLKIRCQGDAKKIFGFIQDFTYNENNLLTYLYAISKTSIRGYYYRNMKDIISENEEECIKNLADSIKRTLLDA